MVEEDTKPDVLRQQAEDGVTREAVRSDGEVLYLRRGHRHQVDRRRGRKVGEVMGKDRRRSRKARVPHNDEVPAAMDEATDDEDGQEDATRRNVFVEHLPQGPAVEERSAKRSEEDAEPEDRDARPVAQVGCVGGEGGPEALLVTRRPRLVWRRPRKRTRGTAHGARLLRCPAAGVEEAQEEVLRCL